MVPPTNVTYSPSFTQPSESFINSSSWEIDLPIPANLTQAETLVFATGVEFVLPSTVTAGGAVPATYTATFEATVQFIEFQWQFLTIPYPPNFLPVDYNALNVLITGPTAGTPQVNPTDAQAPTSVAVPPQTTEPVCLFAPPPGAAVPPPPPAPASVPSPPPPPSSVPGSLRCCSSVQGRSVPLAYSDSDYLVQVAHCSGRQQVICRMSCLSIRLHSTEHNRNAIVGLLSTIQATLGCNASHGVQLN